MAHLCLNHSQGYVKPTHPGQVQHRLAPSAGTGVCRLPCITRMRRGRPVGLPCAAQKQSSVEGAQQNSPATTIISYFKLLTLTGVMAAAMLLDRKPAHAAVAPRPETVHSVVDSSSRSKQGVWQRLKATATAPVGALDRLLFPDEAITFIGSSTARTDASQASSAGPAVAAVAPRAPSAAADVSSYDLTHVMSDDSAGLTSDAESPCQPGAAAMAAALLPSRRQLTAAVAAASDRLAAGLAQITEAVAPGWPAESAALGAVSRLPAELSASFSATADVTDGLVAGAAVSAEDGASAALSPEVARQLVRGGYALAGLVVAVMAWQLAACVADANKPTQAKRAPVDDAWDPHQTQNPPSTTAGISSTPAAAAAAADTSATNQQQQQVPVIQLGPEDALPEALKDKNVVGPFCLKPQPQQQQQPFAVIELQPSDSLPAALQGKDVVGPFCLMPQQQQPQQLPVVELGPEDELPPELQGKNVVGPLCLMRPSLGPASHGHFSAAAVAAAAATADALVAEAQGMRQAAAEAAAESDKPLKLMTVGDAAQKGEQVMKSALAAAAAADTTDSSSTVASQQQQEEEAEGESDAPAVSVQLSEVATASTDDEPLFRVELTVAEGSATAAAAVSDSLEGRLAAEVVKEALVAESCAAAAAAAAERAQIATHLIEDAIAAHSTSNMGSDVRAAGAGSVAAADVDRTANSSISMGGVDSSSQGEGLMTVSWEEVTCSMAAEVREAEVAAAQAPPAAAAVQEVPISWQKPAAPAAGTAAGQASSAEQHIPVSWQTSDAAPVSAKEAIPVVWEKLAGSTAAAVTPVAAAAAAAAAPAAAQEIPVSWQKPSAAAAADADKAQRDAASVAAAEGADLEELAEEAKAAEAAAAEADAARAAAAAAVARVAAAQASLCQQEAQQRLVQEAKAAEAAAAEAEAARAAAAAAVARVAAAKVAAPATGTDATNSSAAATPEESDALAAAATPEESDALAAAAETEELVQEAIAAEAAEAEAARAAAAAAVARMAASKTALVRSAIESVAAAVSTDIASDTPIAELQQDATSPTQGLDAAAAARAAQAELIAEAIAAEAAAVAAEAAAGAADAAAAAEGSAGDAAELVKGWLSSSTAGPAQHAITTPDSSSYSKSSSSNSRIVSGPPVSVSWLLADADESEALSQLTQLAASLGHPAIGPISSSSNTAAVTETDAVASDADADAFKDEFAVPNDEVCTQQQLPTQTAATAADAKQEQQATLADVLDAASRAQMQAASETARKQAQARVVALYRTRRTAAPTSTDSASGSAPAAQNITPASKPSASADRAAPAGGGGGKEGSGGRSSLQQQLACQLGVSDVALAMALAAFEGTEPASPKPPASSTSSSNADSTGVTVLSSSGDPYASTAEAINTSSGSKAVSADAAGSSSSSSKRIDIVYGTLEEESDTFEVAVQRMVLNSARPGRRTSSAGAAATTAADGTPAAPAAKDPSSSKRIDVVIETLEEESDSFEVAVQHMVLNSARPGRRSVKSTSSAIPAAGSRITAHSAKDSSSSATSSSKVAAGAAGKGEVVVVVEETSKGSDSFEVAVKRAVGRTGRVEGTTVSAGGKDSTACSEVPAAAPPAAAAAAVAVKVDAGTDSSSSKGAAAAKADEGSSSSSKVAAAGQGDVRIQIKQPDGKADSFDVAVQRMTSSTAAKKSSRRNSSGSDSDSSSERSVSPSGRHKGFGRVVRTPVRVQQQQQRNRPSTPGVLARVPLYKTSSGPAGALRSLPWWETRAAARRTGSNWSDWEGFKSPEPSSAAAAETVTPETSTAATAAGADCAAPSPAASAAAAPTSIPVEWMSTPTQQKRSELKQRAAAILKQQQQGYGGDAIAAAAAAAAVSAKGSSKDGSAVLPVGWGSKVSSGAVSKKPRAWAVVSSELTQELESEMSDILGSAAAAAKTGSKDLSATFTTPNIPVSGAAPTKTQQLLQKQRLGQQKQAQQGVKGANPQVGRQGPRGFGNQQGNKSSKA